MRTYDVFVSFRSEDTRNNFTGFLFQALSRKGIDAFKDDKDLKKGESIAPELLQAIEGSRLFVMVFSKNYASSTWCLRELAEICNCIETSQRRVLPIFYDVDPSEVRKQSGYFEKAFAEHEKRFKEDKKKMQEVQGWREALKQVTSDQSLWPQCAEIEEIVEKIKYILGQNFSSLPNDDLVGMKSRVEELAQLLCLGDQHILRAHGVEEVYQVQPLNEDVVRLFCRNAFKTIEVLSSSLFCRNVLQWRTALAKFKNNKSKDITNVLRISFDELEDIEKDIFLDIVCFFPICGEQYAKKILDFRGFHHEYGLQILVDISLICMKKGIIHMHSLLSNLGRCIVREKSPKEPRKWSRYLSWNEYLFECLPPSFEANKLVELILYASNIKQLWKGRKCLHNLIYLILSHSKNLIEIHDLIEALNLERLDLQGCIQLKKIHPSIGLLRKTHLLLEVASPLSLPSPFRCHSSSKKQRNPLMKKILGLQAPMELTSCGIKSIFI
ncbi:TMV resistance protein N [Glycine soja]|uniref:TMV resistance protein N n=1 Tax=Glycine soja TaxID=3848 RepID=A0A445KEX0_GLYSO|nr:TMV resistance protein N [Glycine soja]